MNRWAMAWAALSTALSAVAYCWRSEFAHAGDGTVVLLAPYFLLFGLDERPHGLAYAVVQMAYYSVIYLVGRGVWRLVFED